MVMPVQDRNLMSVHLPGPDEIREACRLIQAEWSETERIRRRGIAERMINPRASLWRGTLSVHSTSEDDKRDLHRQEQFGGGE